MKSDIYMFLLGGACFLIIFCLGYGLSDFNKKDILDACIAGQTGTTTYK